MAHVLTGFVIIFVIIGVGWGLGQRRALGKHGQLALSNFVYLIATPCLLFDKITSAIPASEIFSAGFAVMVASSLLTGFIGFACARWVLGRFTGQGIIQMLASSYANGGNLGIPLATYVLGNTEAVIPLMLFQIALYAPVSLTWLDVVGQRQRGDATGARATLVTALKNPMLMMSVAGLVCVFGRVPVPDVVAQPIRILAGSSVPLALVVFGMSLAGSGLLGRATPWPEVAIATVLKCVVHPVVAWALAWGVFGMSGHALMAATVIAALPTAQNVYNYALRFRVGQQVARDSGILTTLLCIPVVMGITVLFHAA